jgi:bifunctional non-homologous end joining protein LigD
LAASIESGQKEVLAELLATLAQPAPVLYSEHLEEEGPQLRERACKMGLEGIVSKRKDGRYRSGRVDTWIKAPCKLRDTFAVVGWAQNGNRFDGFYLAEESGGKLVYAGKIESGWTEQERDTLLARIKPMRTRRVPIEMATEKPKAHWVEPRVLVDVEYRARTSKSGLLRHPRFKGVRADLMDESRQ